MSLVISCLAGKGGVTKTTLARAISAGLTIAGWEGIGVDSDLGQDSLRSFARRREANGITPAIECVALPQVSQIEAAIASDKHDFIVIDGAAYASAITPKLAALSDLIVIPMRFSVDDMESAVKVAYELMQEGIGVDRILFVFSGVVHTKADENNARAYLADTPFNVLPSYIEAKPSYSQAQDVGRSLIETIHPGPRKRAEDVIQRIIDTALHNHKQRGS